MKIKREVKIGFFALLMLFALYWGINFLKGRDIFNRTNTYFATYEQVNGIQRSSPIMIRGFNVGVVSNITYNPGVSEMVVVEFSINSKYRIPDNSQARIFSNGLLGGRAIEIVMGDSERFLQNRDTLYSSTDRDLFEVAGSELEIMKQKVTVIADNLTRTLVTLNDILKNNSENINGTLSNLSEMSSSLNSLISGERESLRGIIKNIDGFTETLNRNSGNMDRLMNDLSGFSGRLADVDLEKMGENLSASLDKLGAILEKMESGEGSMARLLNERELYDSLNSAAANLSELLEDLKANPGRYLNVTVFGGRNR